MLLLLLPLLSGCLTLCVGQSNILVTPTTESSPHVTNVLPTDEGLSNNVAVLLTAVQSTRALNETTLAPVLNKLHDIIQEIQPDAMFSLSLKNYTRV